MLNWIKKILRIDNSIIYKRKAKLGYTLTIKKEKAPMTMGQIRFRIYIQRGKIYKPTEVVRHTQQEAITYVNKWTPC